MSKGSARNQALGNWDRTNVDSLEVSATSDGNQSAIIRYKFDDETEMALRLQMLLK